jgi:Sigma-70 region 2
MAGKAALDRGAEDRERTRLFEQHRARLRGIAYRMLGSVGDAEDLVQCMRTLVPSREDRGRQSDQRLKPARDRAFATLIGWSRPSRRDPTKREKRNVA